VSALIAGACLDRNRRASATPARTIGPWSPATASLASVVHERTAIWKRLMMTMAALLSGAVFAVVGAAAERLASVWPAGEASRRSPGWRTLLFALAAGAGAALLVARARLPTLALAVDLVLMAALAATDLEQRRLPHLLLDPLIILAVAFVPFNPSVRPLDAALGAVAAVAVLWALSRVVRGGLATGDLYLTAPLGLMLGWPTIFIAVFLAGLMSAGASLAMLASGRVGLKSYIPFGPFLVAGAVLALLRDPQLLGQLATALPFR
jgi:leader peptidase (prepilin peptidase)/N-methyltransferase